jgi:iron complex outermembrane receptor protein
VYSARFDDRQLSVATCAGIVGCPSTLVNVGKVDTKGVEAIAVWKFNRELSWFNSATFNDSKYKSNYMDGKTLVAVSGKTVVDAPRQLFNTEVSYENAGWFAAAASTRASATTPTPTTLACRRSGWPTCRLATS